MRTGKLFWNGSLERIDIAFDDGTYYDGLHCGECLEVLVDNEWKSTRIEKRNDWYLVGCFGEGEILTGLKVRI